MPISSVIQPTPFSQPILRGRYDASALTALFGPRQDVRRAGGFTVPTVREIPPASVFATR